MPDGLIDTMPGCNNLSELPQNVSVADLVLRRGEREPHRLCLSTSDLKSAASLCGSGDVDQPRQIPSRHWISRSALADRIRTSRSAGKPLLLLDCRSAVEFGKCHILDSVNVSLPSILYKRLLRGSLHPSAVIAAKEVREKFLTEYRTAPIVLIRDSGKQQPNRNRADSLDSVLDAPPAPPHDSSISTLPQFSLANFSGLSASVGPLSGSQCDPDVAGNPAGDVAILICNRLVEEKCEVAVLADDFQLFAEEYQDLVVGYKELKSGALRLGRNPSPTNKTGDHLNFKSSLPPHSPLSFARLNLSEPEAGEPSDRSRSASRGSRGTVAISNGSDDSCYSSSVSSSARSSDSGTPTEDKANLSPLTSAGDRRETPLAPVPLRYHLCPPLAPVDSTLLSSADTDGTEEEHLKMTSGRQNSNFPVEIIPYLFLGNAKNSSDLETLERYGIRYILNVTPNLPNVFENNKLFKYFQIPITDHWSQNIAQYFQAAIDFIDEGRQKQSGVLVHCLAGISRSVTIVVAYLMMRNSSMTLDAAYDLVKAQKPNISPNFNFMGQLLDWQTQLQSGGKENQDTQCGCGRDGVTHCSHGNTEKYFISSPIALNSTDM